MPILLETIFTEGISQLSYLLADTSTRQAAVIDPRRDVEVYLRVCRDQGLKLTHILETHIHADFVSGARELAARSSGAKILVSDEGLPNEEVAHYHFPGIETCRDGDEISLGDLVLTVCHTPGHTPEHLSFVVADTGAKQPWGVFTGDTLFMGSAGRPDLLDDKEATESLSRQLYQSLYETYLGLPDGTIVYPGHGHGSACGAGIGPRLQTTIGYERATNPFLQYDDYESFREFVLSGVPEEPAHYQRLKRVNAYGPEVLGTLDLPALPPHAFTERMRKANRTVVDVRHMLAFGGGHIYGAVNLEDRPELSVWAGWMLDPEDELLLVLKDDGDLEAVLPLLTRVGFDRCGGYLVGGMTAWEDAGLPIQRLPQLWVDDVEENLEELTVLDVRSPAEFESDRIPGAQHHFVGDMPDGLPQLNESVPTAVYCGSGYRASLAASLLQAGGYHNVHNVPGSWKAWKRRRHPTEEMEEVNS